MEPPDRKRLAPIYSFLAQNGFSPPDNTQRGRQIASEALPEKTQSNFVALIINPLEISDKKGEFLFKASLLDISNHFGLTICEAVYFFSSIGRYFFEHALQSGARPGDADVYHYHPKFAEKKERTKQFKIFIDWMIACTQEQNPKYFNGTTNVKLCRTVAADRFFLDLYTKESTGRFVKLKFLIVTLNACWLGDQKRIPLKIDLILSGGIHNLLFTIDRIRFSLKKYAEEKKVEADAKGKEKDFEDLCNNRLRVVNDEKDPVLIDNFSFIKLIKNRLRGYGLPLADEGPFKEAVVDPKLHRGNPILFDAHFTQLKETYKDKPIQMILFWFMARIFFGKENKLPKATFSSIPEKSWEHRLVNWILRLVLDHDEVFEDALPVLSTLLIVKMCEDDKASIRIFNEEQLRVALTIDDKLYCFYIPITTFTPNGPFHDQIKAALGIKNHVEALRRIFAKNLNSASSREAYEEMAARVRKLDTSFFSTIIGVECQLNAYVKGYLDKSYVLDSLHPTFPYIEGLVERDPQQLGIDILRRAPSNEGVLLYFKNRPYTFIDVQTYAKNNTESVFITLKVETLKCAPEEFKIVFCEYCRSGTYLPSIVEQIRKNPQIFEDVIIQLFIIESLTTIPTVLDAFLEVSANKELITEITERKDVTSKKYTYGELFAFVNRTKYPLADAFYTKLGKLCVDQFGEDISLIHPVFFIATKTPLENPLKCDGVYEKEVSVYSAPEKCAQAYASFYTQVIYTLLERPELKLETHDYILYQLIELNLLKAQSPALHTCNLNWLKKPPKHKFHHHYFISARMMIDRMERLESKDPILKIWSLYHVMSGFYGNWEVSTHLKKDAIKKLIDLKSQDFLLHNLRLGGYAPADLKSEFHIKAEEIGKRLGKHANGVDAVYIYLFGTNRSKGMPNQQTLYDVLMSSFIEVLKNEMAEDFPIKVQECIRCLLGGFKAQMITSEKMNHYTNAFFPKIFLCAVNFRKYDLSLEELLPYYHNHPNLSWLKQIINTKASGSAFNFAWIYDLMSCFSLPAKKA